MGDFARTSAFLHFRDMARAFAREMEELHEKVKALGDPDPTQPDWITWHEAETLRYQKAIAVIVFSAMLVEAFINDYAARRLGQDYFDSYIDKMDLKAKWAVVPQLASGRALESLDKSGAGVLNQLNQLIKVRNYLVHYKSVDLIEVIGKAVKNGHMVIDADGRMTSPAGAPNPFAKLDLDALAEARNAINVIEALATELDRIDEEALAGLMMGRRNPIG